MFIKLDNGLYLVLDATAHVIAIFKTLLAAKAFLKTKNELPEIIGNEYTTRGTA